MAMGALYFIIYCRSRGRLDVIRENEDETFDEIRDKAR